MKANLFKIYQLIVLSCAILVFTACQKPQQNILDFFVQDNLRGETFKTFYLSTDFNDQVIFKQVINKGKEQDEVYIEYVYMTKDSIPYLNGIERIRGNTLEFVEQYIYVEGRKIPSETLGEKTWNLLQDAEKKIELKFNDEKTKISFEIKSEAKAVFKDTLDTQMLVVEYSTNTTYFKNGLKIKDEPSKSIRYYQKNSGLVCYTDTYSNLTKTYRIKNN